MEQNEQVICTISKYKIHISNQDFITPKGKNKNFVQTNNKHSKQLFAKEEKRKKVKNPSWIE